MELQTLVGATPVDGVFGNMTKAKVMAWQANNGLVADGVFGPASIAKANGVVSGNFPAGCTSASGYSTTTGQACVAIPSTLPAGCSAGAMFSSTTGQACTGTTTPGNLQGAEGSITVSDFTSGTEQTLGEGKTEKVLGFKVAADEGSDVSLNTVKVTLDWVGTGSSRVERYFDEVEIYMGSTKVGSANIDDFSKVATGEYSKSIALSNAVVEMDSDAKFYVQLTAIDSIDTENQDATWDVAVTSIRFTDAMGVVSTDSVEQDSDGVEPVTVDFEDSTDNDGITSSSSSSNPDATTLKVEDDGVSEEYKVLVFKLKADTDSSDLNILDIPITVTTSATSEAEGVVSDIYLKVGSTVYDDYEYASTNDGVYTFSIDEGDFVIEGGESVEVSVYVKFAQAEDTDTTYSSGDTISFTFDGDLLVVENTEGDSVPSAVTDRAGNQMTLSIDSVVISGYSWVINSTGTLADFFFTVEADEEFDVLVDDISDAISGVLTATDTTGIETVELGVLTRYSGDSVETISGEGYTVAGGDEVTFRVRYSMTGSNGDSAEITIDTIAGQTVTEDKQTSPTITRNVNS
jgi:peptidoglycan hydrolase-like protein with peptidoglycan-binding domain